MNKKSIYCTAPWNGLTVREDGKVLTCCIGLKSLGNLNTQSIQEIENSKSLQQIKQDMLSDSPNLENCKFCVQLEQHTGYAPTREHYNKNYPTISDSLKLQSLDIRWNNVCNLGCLYCSPTFSNTWSDRLGIDITTPPVKPYQDDLLAWILERADHIKELMLVGGEPLLMKQNYKLLARLPEHCQISIITNMSYDLAKNPAFSLLLARPTENIIWNVSMENIGDKFEYVRSGASWAQVKQNLKLLLQHWPNTVSLNMVYNLFSAFDITETVQEFRDIGIKKITLFNINGNTTIDLFNMPEKIKELALTQLQDAYSGHINSLHPEDRELYPWTGFTELAEQLKKPTVAPLSLKEFNDKIQWYNKWSDQKFADLWPEVNQLIHSTLK
jgi:radical SAM protein with 4Fe4S-binding SPASM domain